MQGGEGPPGGRGTGPVHLCEAAVRDAILAGTKTVELRTDPPNLPDGSLVILYSSTPTRAVVGWAHLMASAKEPPRDLGRVRRRRRHRGTRLRRYFDGTDQAFALELDDVVAAAQPVPLSVIRSIGIQPPQSWRYVPADVTTQIQQSALA